MELVHGFLRHDLIDPRRLDFKGIVAAGTICLAVLVPVISAAFEFVSLPKLPANSALRYGLLYILLVLLVASLWTLYARDRAYYSPLQRLLARVAVVATAGGAATFVWIMLTSVEPALVAQADLAYTLLGLAVGGGGVWLIFELARDCTPPAKHIFVICDIGDEEKKEPGKWTYLTRVLVDELTRELQEDRHRVRVQHLGEVVDSQERARRLGNNARGTVIVFGHVAEARLGRAMAKLYTKFEVLRTPRYYPGTLGLRHGAIVGLENFALRTELTNATLCLSRFLVGLFYYWEKRYEDALRLFTRTLDLLPAEITELGRQEVLLYCGNALYKLGRYFKALDAYTEAVSVDPSFARAYNNRGACRGKLGEALAAEGDLAGARAFLREAVEDFSHAIANNPSLTVAYLDRARVLAQQQCYEEAVRDYGVVIASDPHDPAVRLGRAEAQARVGAYEDAIADLSRVMRLAPNNMLARLNRAGCNHQLKRYSRAIDDYTRVVKLVPNSPYAGFAHRKLGDIFSAKGEAERAIDCYTRALRLDPRNAALCVNRGNNMVLLNRFAEAAKDFTRAIDIDRSLPNAYCGLGCALLHLGELQQGLDNLARAVELDPTYQPAVANLKIARDLLAAQEFNGAASA